jgi:DNA polymerase beta
MTDHRPAIIDALDTMRKRDVAEKRHFQARAYTKVISQLKTMEKPILTSADADGLEGVGTKIKEKIREIIETGSLRAAEKAKAEYPIELYDSLQKIYGVGPVKAKDLVEKEKVKSIEDLRAKVAKDPKLLNENQKIGLKYYEDINERIPRKEMTAHAAILMSALPASLEGTIVGSYRRQAETSGDIDMLLKGSEGFKEYIATLKKKNYIVETLAEGDKKCLAVAQLSGASKGRRLDLLVTPKEEYAYAILYFTGSDVFNVAMRRYALTLGYSLNEHTMKPVEPEVGLPPDMETEEDIFQFLGLQYIEPKNRKGEADIIPVKKVKKLTKR